MEQKKRRLPSLKSLLFLESVVRTGSVTAAADELSITHSAVSKQLSQLEVWLGVPLFTEKRRGMIPTAAVAKIASVVDKALDDIQHAVDDVKPVAKMTPNLKVIAPATFAMRWLIPKLPEFHSADRGFGVMVQTTHTPDNWLDFEFDVAIRRGGVIPKQFAPRALFSEQLTLVSSCRPGEQDLDDPAEHIEKFGLLDVATRPGELREYLAAVGLSTALSKRARTMPHFYVGLDAMLGGRGALVAPDYLMEGHFARGEVQEVFPDVLVAGPTYQIFINPQSQLTVAAAGFVEWVRSLVPQKANAKRLTERLQKTRRQPSHCKDHLSCELSQPR
ncbi:LysR family transcriptional regulator [Mesorhizobium sp. PL10]